MPTVSVIVPVYKVEPYLKRCVDSILAQTYSDFELILVDDGSPDRCPEICDEYAAKDERIHVIHQSNGGLSAARNAGIDWSFANSNSEWLTFIDSDDDVLPTYLEDMLMAVEQNHCKIGMCQTLILTSKGDINPQKEDGETHVMTPKKIWESDNVIACAKLYCKELFRFVRFPVGKINEDMFTTYKLLFQVEKIAFVFKKLYRYVCLSESITRNPDYKFKYDLLLALLEQIRFFSNNKELLDLKQGAERHFSIEYFSRIRRAKRVMDKSERKKYLSQLNNDISASMKNCFSLPVAFIFLPKLYSAWISLKYFLSIFKNKYLSKR